MTLEQRRQLNKELYAYIEYKDRVREKLSDCFYGGLTTNYASLRVSGGGGNGAENRVVKSLSDTERMTLWVRVFEFTLIKYTGEQKDLLFRKKYIEGKGKRQICREVSISERTYAYWFNEILETAFKWARAFKLI